MSGPANRDGRSANLHGRQSRGGRCAARRGIRRFRQSDRESAGRRAANHQPDRQPLASFGDALPARAALTGASETYIETTAPARTWSLAAVIRRLTGPDAALPQDARGRRLAVRGRDGDVGPHAAGEGAARPVVRQVEADARAVDRLTRLVGDLDGDRAGCPRPGRIDLALRRRGSGPVERRPNRPGSNRWLTAWREESGAYSSTRTSRAVMLSGPPAFRAASIREWDFALQISLIRQDLGDDLRFDHPVQAVAAQQELGGRQQRDGVGLDA